MKSFPRTWADVQIADRNTPTDAGQVTCKSENSNPNLEQQQSHLGRQRGFPGTTRGAREPVERGCEAGPGVAIASGLVRAHPNSRHCSSLWKHRSTTLRPRQRTGCASPLDRPALAHTAVRDLVVAFGTVAAIPRSRNHARFAFDW